MPGGGGTTQTAVNRLAGARTQMSDIVTVQALHKGRMIDRAAYELGFVVAFRAGLVP